MLPYQVIRAASGSLKAACKRKINESRRLAKPLNDLCTSWFTFCVKGVVSRKNHWFIFCSRAYQGLRNVRFTENLTCFVFLKHPFWYSPFCLITDDLYRRNMSRFCLLCNYIARTWETNRYLSVFNILN